MLLTEVNQIWLVAVKRSPMAENLLLYLGQSGKFKTHV